MIKRNFKTMLVTTLVILLPIVAGLMLWDRLPEQVPFHWNINGEVDGWATREFAIFAMPMLMAGLQWLSAYLTDKDPKKSYINNKMAVLVLWIVPTMSLLLHSMVYCTALGIDVAVELIIPMVFGALFVCIGNYLPKCRQSYVVGIKLPWTLADEGTWNATHRFAGWSWSISGVLVMVTAFLGNVWLPLTIFLVMLITTVAYSYLYYLKHRPA